MLLPDLLAQSALRSPDATAVRGPDGAVSYRDLDRASNQLARALAQLGVKKGDRVGIWLEKSARAVIAMQAALRLGAAYVPIDPLSPTTRALNIAEDCSIRALVTTRERSQRARAAASLVGVPRVVVEGSEAGDPAEDLAWTDLERLDPGPLELPSVGPDDLAYILYTSGSTGKPKGVCISHQNALSFIDWAAEEIDAEPADRFSNHAPFHFDLSVLDLYVAFKAGASVSIVPEGLAYAPRALVEFLHEQEITVWYSVPSALILMMDEGGLLDLEQVALRVILFAGEPFPIKHLRRLYERWPDRRYLNLYGPTETNVCTFFEVKELSPERTQPVPIGRACSGDRVWAVKPDGTTAGVGEEGELLAAGPTVLLGYWGRPPHGDGPYPTGDIVRVLPDGEFEYVGRRDHMVKVRGHRVELGEVEAALLDHPRVHETAVVVAGSGMETRLVAFVVPAGDEAAPGLLELKRHCSERVPRYMIVDAVRPIAVLPRTRNGKIDRLELSKLATELSAN